MADVSLSETSREDLVDALGIHERVLGAPRSTRGGYASRAFHADGESVVFVASVDHQTRVMTAHPAAARALAYEMDAATDAA